MTERPWLFASRWLAVLALVAYCLWRSIAAAAAYFGSADAYSYLSAWRSAARDAPSGRLALLCADVHSISPVERSRMVAMSWERAPSPIDVIDQSSDLEPVNCVLSSIWHPASIGRRLESSGFSAVSTNEYVKTWSRASYSMHIPCRRPLGASIHREIAALAVELQLLLIVFALFFGLRDIRWWKLIAPIVVASVLGAVALSHPLLAPNGLGVYGGKAKLLYECGGMPGEFLDSAGGMALQPSYPPGLTLLAYFHFALSGGCGDRLVQLYAGRHRVDVVAGVECDLPRQPVRGGFGAGTCRDVPFRGRRCGRHFRLGGMLCARRHPRQDLRNRTVGCADSRLGCCCKIARIRAHRRLEFLHCAKPWACRICGMVRGEGVGHVRCSDCGCGVSCPTFLQAVLGS